MKEYLNDVETDLNIENIFPLEFIIFIIDDELILSIETMCYSFFFIFRQMGWWNFSNKNYKRFKSKSI